MRQVKPRTHNKFKVGATDHLHYLAFQNSNQANIISLVSNGKIISANRAACQVLGYSKKELLTKCWSNLFDINQSDFKKQQKQKTPQLISKPILTAVKKNGKLIQCEITSAIFIDEDGIEKDISTLSDITKSILEHKQNDLQKEELVEQNILLAEAKQKVIDEKNEKIVANNISLAKLKQRGIDTLNDKIVAENIILAKTKQENIDHAKEIVVAENIELALEKSNTEVEERLDQEQQLLKEINDSFRLIFNSTSDVLFDYDVEMNQVLISDAFEKEYGYVVTPKVALEDCWINHIHPEDKDVVTQDFQRMLSSADKKWKYSYRFLRSNHLVVNVLSNAIICRDVAGTAYRIIGAMHDFDKQAAIEENLQREIEQKERQIEEAAAEAKEAERSKIGMELHDNVNQLLGVSRLYLDMAKHGGEKTEMYLSRSSKYLAMAIDEIRSLTKKLTNDNIKNLGLFDTIEMVIRDIKDVNPLVISFLRKGLKEDSLNEAFKLNIFRIIQEQLNNILKHAKATKAIIELLQNKKEITLSISDDGVGLDILKKSNGIGMSNIKSRAATFNGEIDFASKSGKGCVLIVKFPMSVALMNKN